MTTVDHVGRPNLPPGITRRAFLAAVLGGAGAAVLHDLLAPTISWTAPDGEGVLLVVYLGGGNDGLNTVAPVHDGRYRNLRGSLALDPASALPLEAGLALHPALVGLKAQWDAGHLAVLQGVGAAKYDLSHFAMADTVMRGQADGATGISGWLGRWLDGRPDAGTNPLVGVALGSGTPLHLIGTRVRASSLPVSLPWNTLPGLARWDDSSARILAALRSHTRGSTGLGPLGDAARDGMLAALDLDDRLRPWYEETEGDELEFRIAARLVSAGLGIRVVSLVVGGFDTHSGQDWAHADALGRVDRGLSAFFAELDAPWANRAAALVWSEFGRTVAANGSGGTDHGTASTWLLVGDRVRGGRYGEAPSLADLDPAGYPKATVDVRDVYATLVESWLGGDPAEVVGPGRTNLGCCGTPSGGPNPPPPPPPPPRVVPVPPPPPAARPVAFESFEGHEGWVLGSIAAGTAPSRRSTLELLEAPPDRGDWLGTRLRTLVAPPSTGAYTFFLAADDHAVLHLSSDESKASTRVIARVEAWTDRRAWSQRPGQRSAPVWLEAGRRYYLEAYAKEGDYGDHLAVAWEGPGVRRQLVAGDACTAPGDTGGGGWDPLPGIRPVVVDRWTGREVWQLDEVPNGRPHDARSGWGSPASPGGGRPGSTLRAVTQIRVPTPGRWRFAVAAGGPTRVALWASAVPSGAAAAVAEVDEWTSFEEIGRLPGQISRAVSLDPAVAAHVEVHSCVWGDEQLVVCWEGPSTPMEPIPGDACWWPTVVPIGWWPDPSVRGPAVPGPVPPSPPAVPPPGDDARVGPFTVAATRTPARRQVGAPLTASP